MALSKSRPGFVLLFLVSLLATSSAYEVVGGAKEAVGGQLKDYIKIAEITEAMYRKGYGAMAVLLPEILEPYTLQPPHMCNPLVVGKLTIFAPTDYAFSEALYPGLTLSELLRYQIVPFLHLPKAAFYKQLKTGDFVETLRPSSPLMFTPNGPNYIRVQEYGIYDDGQVVVHGVQHFFDPANQLDIHHKDWTIEAGYGKCSTLTRRSRPDDAIPVALSPMTTTTFITPNQSPSQSPEPPQ